MCGIAGAVALEGPLNPALRDALPAMTRTLERRGPDEEGLELSERFAFGHRRLSIIDLSSGQQPMKSADGQLCVVFNGEIYNHRALRSELEALGHVFRTQSDTEAILHAYAAWGTSAVARLEGMFAFALWDARDHSCLLARDRLGKKPLFYAELGGALCFASEVKALERCPFWVGEIDTSALEGYLSLGYTLAPDTIFKGVRKLRPGHWMQVRGGRCVERCYWEVTRFDDDPRRGSALQTDLETALRRATHERLESEVPLGAFLSGGIDSGLIVSFMAEALGGSVDTTSVGFGERGHNELEAAAMTAGHFGTRHHVELVQPKLETVFERVVRALDEPLADSSVIPTWYVSKMARRHVTVALTGDGGDESFGGYDFRYQPHAVEQGVRRFRPRPLAPALRWLGERWPRGPQVPKPLRLATLIENLGYAPAEAYYLDLCFLPPAEARALCGLDPARDPRRSPVFAAVTEPYQRCPSRSVLQKAMYADLKIYLPNDVLVKVDRMSMDHSLEVRSPLLDRRVVEMAFRLPARRKMPGLRPKRLLRELARGRLPAGLWRLPKRGFTAPVSSWLAGAYKGAYRDEVFAKSARIRSWLDVAAIERRFDAHCRGERDDGYLLWAVWVLERWAQQRSRAA